MVGPCVIGVAAPDALAWVRGRLDDPDLLLDATLKPEGVFLMNLPSIAAWRAAVRKIVELRRSGAQFLITRTRLDAIDDHLVKAGAIPTLKEGRGRDAKFRFILCPQEFHAYFGRLDRAFHS